MEATREYRASERAAEEAGSWLIALQEDPDDRRLRRRFEAWRKASPLNEAAWQRTQRMIGLAAGLQPQHADRWAGFVASRRQAQAPAPPRARSSRRWMVAGLGLAAAAVVALVVGPALLVRLQSDYRTATAELRTIELEDGSRVTLAGASAIAVAFTGGEREVTLVDGEAFFQVKPDAARPFRVVAGSVRTTVVGTSFDVRREEAGVTVSVEQGTVQVSSTESGARERLEAGDSARVDWKGTAVRATDPTPIAAGWRQGKLLAQNQSLADAVDQLRRYYDGRIVVAGDGLGARRITGVYNLAEPEEALRAIADAHGARVRRITPWLLVVLAD
ncbi:FecR family protein [Reyranella sp.]|uniref:FecR family protein n=1 Tax=Reyranella sp. TaxID=1929291 RepID=UPI003BABC40C